MKTEQKTITVEITLWTCHNKDHRHKSKEVAQKCIVKTLRAIAYKKTNPPIDHKHRNAMILNDRASGMTYRAIGIKLGLSGNHIATIEHKALREAERKADRLQQEAAFKQLIDFSLLSEHIKNRLYLMRAWNPHILKDNIKTGVLNRDSGLNASHLQELLRWLNTLPGVFKWHEDLCSDVSGLLQSYGFKSREQVICAFDRAENPIWTPHGECMIPQLGSAGYAQLCEWIQQKTIV